MLNATVHALSGGVVLSLCFLRPYLPSYLTHKLLPQLSG